MHKPLIIANWKMNPATFAEAVLLARKIERGLAGIRGVEVVIAPPFPFLMEVGRVLKKSKLGSQDIFWADIGPYTGEVSWRQLKEVGAEYAIIGHSERKLHIGENDEMINKKVRAALEHGVSPVLCIGERERAGNDIPGTVGEQLKNALRGVKKSFLKGLIVAYEPVWAISTMPGARPDTPDNAFRALVYIRKTITRLYGRTAGETVRIIYGGSVKAGNIASFLREGKMEGALVGGASLDPKEFVKIVRIAASNR